MGTASNNNVVQTVGFVYDNANRLGKTTYTGGQSHYKKTRYKGLTKNTAQLYSLFGLANLVIAKKKLLHAGIEGMSAP